MSFPKFIALTAFCLFSVITLLAIFKRDKGEETPPVVRAPAPIEIELYPDAKNQSPVQFALNPSMDDLPDADRIDELFNLHDPKLPIVQTIAYRSRVAWQKGRPAWISDYASHYKTSRHFIARSLNGAADYFKQNVAEGDRFNVFDENKNFEFNLVIDLSRCKMWFYYYDLDKNERGLIKTYPVGLGRLDQTKTSGCLTPLGKFSLGDKIVIYKPKMVGHHDGQKIEMVRVFGSRWIPFEKELDHCTSPAKGFGLHGVPWIENEQHELVPDEKSVGKYESDGCIRLGTADIEELFAIIITKPTSVEIVKDFHEAKLYGVER